MDECCGGFHCFLILCLEHSGTKRGGEESMFRTCPFDLANSSSIHASARPFKFLRLTLQEPFTLVPFPPVLCSLLTAVVRTKTDNARCQPKPNSPCRRKLHLDKPCDHLFPELRSIKLLRHWNAFANQFPTNTSGSDFFLHSQIW